MFLLNLNNIEVFSKLESMRIQLKTYTLRVEATVVTPHCRLSTQYPVRVHTHTHVLYNILYWILFAHICHQLLRPKTILPLPPSPDTQLPIQFPTTEQVRSRLPVHKHKSNMHQPRSILCTTFRVRTWRRIGGGFSQTIIGGSRREMG